MANYDKYYKTENLFGKPYPELVEFFKQHEPKGKLLDLGCGQGRNALFLAKQGYFVTGIDQSKVGIDQMNSMANKEELQLKGFVGDLYTFNRIKEYDIVLLDSMFHFEKRDLTKETELLIKIAKEIHDNALLCVCIQDSGRKVKILKDTIRSSGLDFEVLNDSSLTYRFEDKESGHSSESKYNMFIVQKA